MNADLIGQPVGSGAMAEVFAYGEDVVKLYRRPEHKAAAFMEAAILAIVSSHALPVPSVREVGLVNGRWALVMSAAPGRPYDGPDDETINDSLDQLARIHRAIHACEESRLRPLKARLHTNIARGTRLDRAQRDR